jgi:tripartite-type tricarboxylate transporter receptor subunit TctC
MRYQFVAAFALGSTQLTAIAGGLDPVQLVHPFPPSGPAEVAGTAVSDRVLRTMQRYAVPAFTDILAMHVAQTLQGASSEPVVVVRRSRLGGREAVAAVSRAPADGRTLLLASGPDGAGFASSAWAVSDASLKRVSLVAGMPYVLIAAREPRYAKADDLLAATRVGSSIVFVASPGERTAGHLAIERLRSLGRTPFEPVAYNGGMKALDALVTRQVTAAIVPLPAALPYLPAGRLHALAIAETRRHPAIPLVPTNAEAGLPALNAITWFAVLATANTAPAIIRDIEARLARLSEAPDARQLFYDLGLRLEPDAAPALVQRGMTGTTSRDALRPPS